MCFCSAFTPDSLSLSEEKHLHIMILPALVLRWDWCVQGDIQCLCSAKHCEHLIFYFLSTFLLPFFSLIHFFPTLTAIGVPLLHPFPLLRASLISSQSHWYAQSSQPQIGLGNFLSFWAFYVKHVTIFLNSHCSHPLVFLFSLFRALHYGQGRYNRIKTEK